MSNEAMENLKVLVAVRKMFKSGEAKRIRETADITLREAAAAAGFSAQVLCRFEGGHHIPRPATVYRYWPVLQLMAAMPIDLPELPADFPLKPGSLKPGRTWTPPKSWNGPEPRTVRVSEENPEPVGYFDYVGMRKWLRLNAPILWGQPHLIDLTKSAEHLRQREEDWIDRNKMAAVEAFLVEHPEMRASLRAAS